MFVSYDSLKYSRWTDLQYGKSKEQVEKSEEEVFADDGKLHICLRDKALIVG